MNTRNVVLAAVILLASVLCAQAQILEIEPKMPTVSLVATPTPTPTATPTPTPKPAPTPPIQETATDYSWMWLVIGAMLILGVIGFFVWTRTRKPKEESPVPTEPSNNEEPNPDDHDGPRYPNTAKVDWPSGPRPTPRKEHSHTSEQSQVVWAPELEVTPPPASEEPSDDTDPKGSGPKTIALILALGLSFAQAGMVFAECAPTGVPEGSKIVKEQTAQFIEIRTSGCSNITAIGVVPGVEFTQVNFYPRSGRVTAMVTATKETEVGRFRFKIRDGAKEYTSPRNVTLSVWGVDAAEVHNGVEEVKTSVTNLAGTVKKGVATLNGQINTLQVETDRVKAEMKAKADNDQMKAEIDKAVKAAVEPIQIELEEAKKAVSGMSKGIYDNTVAVSNAFELIGGLASQTKRSWFLGKKKETNKPIAITAERLRKLNATRAAALKKAKPEVKEYDDSER